MLSTGSIPDHGPTVLAVTTVSLVVALLFVILRLVSRIFLVRIVALEDYLIIIGAIFAAGLSLTINYATKNGLGKHDVDIDPSWMPILRKCEYIFSILYNPALMATKSSMLVLYLRLSKKTKEHMSIGSYVTLGVVNLAGFVLTILNIFQCSPVSAAYKSSGNDSAHCIPLVTLYLTSAPVNIITDLAILVLPIPTLTKMHLPQKQKNILIATFTLGVFVTIVDVVRIYYLQQASTDSTGALSSSTGSVDFAWFASLSLMWTAVEVNTGLVCAVIPTLKPLISRLFPRMLNTSHQSSTRGGTLPALTDAGGDEEVSQPIQLNPVTSGVAFSQSALKMGGNKSRRITFDARVALEEDISGEDEDRHYNNGRSTNMLKTKGRESFKACAIVTILFFIWGFSYGLLNTLNGLITSISHSTASQNLQLQSAYFGGYFFGPLTVGRWALKRGGFKATFMTGLCIYGTATLMFWPSAVLISIPGFFVSNFVVGFGLSVLETAANPFLALCGPSDYSEMRLLTAQGVQAVGSIISPILAEKVLFSGVDNTSLIHVQWTYLAIALLSVVIALFFYYVPLPEASDKDLHQERQFKMANPENTTASRAPASHIGKYRVVYITVTLGIAAQFLYVAAQESLSVYFTVLLNVLDPTETTLTITPDNYVLTAHGTFAIGRFVFAALCLVLKPHILLLICFLGTLLCSVLVFALVGTNVNMIGGLIVLYCFFEGPIFPLIFAISLRGLGRGTKTAGACLTAAVSGGAIVPWILYAMQVDDGKSVQYSYCAIVATYAFGLLFPLYLCCFGAAREQIDPRPGKGSIYPFASRYEDRGGTKRENGITKQVSIFVTRAKKGSEGSRGSGEFPIVEHAGSADLHNWDQASGESRHEQ